MQTTEHVWAALRQLPDPELPVLSIVDLGIVRSLEVRGRICELTISPTFVGCPALRSIRSAIEGAISELGLEPRVTISYADRGVWGLAPDAVEKLRQVGVALAEPGGCGRVGLVELRNAKLSCPYCGSRQSKLVNGFAATPCRAVRQCKNCEQPFEQLKLPARGEDPPGLESGNRRDP